eukprot:CAMPEP_0115836584 /NCGR_PEP_ID=MMETSP0287-20121206/4782_1 /TAXON_ID=412157 /ORGANISM="Chrysochromulina rotalis, Strain UIO044" /LENGTH=75 /DNA_ID=CAMNT_0003290071 /DNA_START=547 /DNA_END=774 /DNA_ORIENTATION=+
MWRQNPGFAPTSGGSLVCPLEICQHGPPPLSLNVLVRELMVQGRAQLEDGRKDHFLMYGLEDLDKQSRLWQSRLE